MYVIHACASLGSNQWMWVSKEPGRPWTTMKDNARRYRTYAGAVRAMNELKATANHWRWVGNAYEVYKID